MQSPSKWQVCYLPAFKIVPNSRLDSGVWRVGERRKGSCFDCQFLRTLKFIFKNPLG